MGYLVYLKDEDNALRDAFLGVSSEDPDYLAANVLEEPAAKPWRTSEGRTAAETLDIHFGAPRSADLVAIVGHNFTAEAVLTLRADDTYPPTTTIATIPWRERLAWKSFSETTKRYWRLVISDPSNSDGVLAIGYLALGLKTQLSEGFLLGYETVRQAESRRIITEFGVPILGRRVRKNSRVVLSFEGLNNSRRDELDEFLRSLDRDRKPLILVPNPDQSDAYFARLTTDYSVRQSFPGLADIENVEFEEDNLGELVIDPLPSYTDGDVTGWTLERAGAASKKDSSLKLIRAAADVLRSGHYLTAAIRGTLLEGIGTNAWSRSEELDNAAWTKTNASITANILSSPDALSTADKLVENTSAGVHEISRTDITSATASTKQALSLFAKADTRTKIRVVTRDKAGTLKNNDIDLATGTAITVASGVVLEIEPYRASWWRILVQFDSGTGAIAVGAAVRLLDAGGSDSYTGDGTSGAYLWGFQFEIDAPWPTSYIPTSATGASRAADQFQISFPFIAQPLTWYVRAIEIGQKQVAATAGNDAALAIGTATINSELRVGEGTSQWGIVHEDQDAAEVASAVAVGSSWAETQEFLGQVYQDGAVQAVISINGAAPSSGTKSVASDNPATNWGSPGPIRSIFGSKSAGLLLQRFALRRGVTSDFEEFRAVPPSALPPIVSSGQTITIPPLGGGGGGEEEGDDMALYGPYASKPASAANGQIYIPTDSIWDRLVWNTGVVSWDHYIGNFRCNLPPAAAQWTWQNQPSGYSIADFHSALKMVTNPGGSNNFAYLTDNNLDSLGTPFTIEAGFIYIGTADANDVCFGIVGKDGASAKFESVHLGGGGAQIRSAFVQSHYTNPTTWNMNIGSIRPISLGFGRLLLLRYHDNDTTHRMDYVSSDGFTWVKGDEWLKSTAPFSTVAKVGFGANANTAGVTDSVIYLVHWKQT